MRTTLALDDELVAQAQACTRLTGKSALIREALKALIERESARRLILLGGSEPDIDVITPRDVTCSSGLLRNGEIGQDRALQPGEAIE